MSEIPKIIVHQKADEDLEDIFDYSMERFGFQRAVRYIKDIETMFKALARDQHKGKTFDPQTPYYLHQRIESHFIYYSECKGGIEIFRVLHERMLPAKYLIDMND